VPVHVRGKAGKMNHLALIVEGRWEREEVSICRDQSLSSTETAGYALRRRSAQGREMPVRKIFIFERPDTVFAARRRGR